MALISY